MITIVLADDHKIMRQGIRALLSAERDFQVVGEAASGQEAVTLLERLQPDVLLTDLMMGGMSGIDVIRRARERSPASRCVVLSMYNSYAYVSAALEAGASGYVLKESSSEDLVQAIREAVAGCRFLSAALSE